MSSRRFTCQLAAYEVYEEIFGLEALWEMLAGDRLQPVEMTALLYARAFPRAEWKRRVAEAFTDLTSEAQ